jgi:amphi-Trp domain-containing protein
MATWAELQLGGTVLAYPAEQSGTAQTSVNPMRKACSRSARVDARSLEPTSPVAHALKGNLMKKQKLEFSEQQTLDVCIRQLEGLLERLKSGTLSLSQADQKLWLRPGGPVDIELRAEQSGERESLEIHLEWQRASLHVVGGSTPEDAPPKTVRGWQEVVAGAV